MHLMHSYVYSGHTLCILTQVVFTFSFTHVTGDDYNMCGHYESMFNGILSQKIMLNLG